MEAAKLGERGVLVAKRLNEPRSFLLPKSVSPSKAIGRVALVWSL